MAKLIQFTFDGTRHTLGAAKLTTRQVGKAKELIDLAKKSHGNDDPALKTEVEELIDKVPDSVVEKLREVGLLEKTQKLPTTLEPFIAYYVASRTDVKPATKEIYRQATLSLMALLGDVPLRSVTKAKAKQFKIDLEATKAQNKETTMAPSTVKKRIDFARQIFEHAQDSRLITENPFDKVKGKKSKPAEHAEVTGEMYDAVLAVCPSQDWRMILALARYGGMRCPSEVLSLRWQDVLWDQDRMVVTSPKTEHHAGKDRRVVPLYPEVRAELESSLELAEDGAVYVVHERFRRAAQSDSGWRNSNLRTTFEKLVWRAGLKPWPRLFHSMRSSRATELLDHFPIHVVAAWQGSSVKVLSDHYAKVRGDHFLQAAGLNAELIAKASAQKCAAVRDSAAYDLHRLAATNPK